MVKKKNEDGVIKLATRVERFIVLYGLFWHRVVYFHAYLGRKVIAKFRSWDDAYAFKNMKQEELDKRNA